jgi:hypothetical protein
LRSKSSQQIEDPFDKIINNEIKIWLSTINEIKITSTKQFWFELKNKLPDLYLLSLRLLNIPFSSSSNEAFFSVSGLVNSISAQMDEDLLINRALLKVNINLIDDFQ